MPNIIWKAFKIDDWTIYDCQIKLCVCWEILFLNGDFEAVEQYVSRSKYSSLRGDIGTESIVVDYYLKDWLNLRGMPYQN